MLTKKISILICTLLLVVSSTVGASALPLNRDDNNRDTSNSLNTSSESSPRLSDDADTQKYTVEVFGNNAVCHDLRYYVKCLSFTAYSNEQEYDVLVWIDKFETSKARLFFTDAEGKKLTTSSLPFIAQNTLDVSESDKDDHFEIVLDNNSLVVNDITFIHGVDYISNLQVFKVSSTIKLNEDPLTQDSNAPTDSTSLESSEPEEHSSLTEIAPSLENEGNEEEDKTGGGLLTVIIVVLVLILALAAVFVFSRNQDLVKKLLSSRSGDNKAKSVNCENNSAVQKQNPQVPKAVPVNAPPKADIPVTKTSPVLNQIPTCEPQPIKQSYTQNPTNEEIVANTNQIPTQPIMQPHTQIPSNEGNVSNATASEINRALAICENLLVGQKRGDVLHELPAECIPLCLNNIYALNVSKEEAPTFQATRDAKSADYLLVKNQLLILNPLKFYGRDFKTYSNISGISRCFDIKKNTVEVAPYGQSIIEFGPAEITPNGMVFVLSEKGKISVE